MVPFAGWEMPIQYGGILPEHEAVRSGVGVFDISHMGEFEIEGPGACAWLDGLLTNEVAALAIGEGHYTLLLNEAGGVIDDLILYRSGEERFFLVVNASRIEQDREWMLAHPAEGVVFRDRSAELGALAVQGPKAVALWERIAADRPLSARNRIAEYGSLILCRTGYTGEDGFELFVPAAGAPAVWEALLAAGAAPIGLGARDTLRLEARLSLYGNDIDRGTTPLEAGLGWVVKLDKLTRGEPFVGAEALAAQKAAGLGRTLVGFKVQDRNIARHGAEVVDAGGAVIGQVTSGGPAPTVGGAVGLAYVPVALAAPGTILTISQRGRSFPAEVVKGPFYRRAEPAAS